MSGRLFMYVQTQIKQNPCLWFRRFKKKKKVSFSIDVTGINFLKWIWYFKDCKIEMESHNRSEKWSHMDH